MFRVWESHFPDFHPSVRAEIPVELKLGLIRSCALSRGGCEGSVLDCASCALRHTDPGDTGIPSPSSDVPQLPSLLARGRSDIV